MSVVREFWLKNKKSTIDRRTWYSLNELETGFLAYPEGLGVENDFVFNSYSNALFTANVNAKQPNIEGELIFEDYAGYREFNSFCAVGDLSLVYVMPDTSASETYVKKIELNAIEKGELKPSTGCLHCKVSFLCKTMWLKADAGGEYGVSYSTRLKYVDDHQANGTITITNDTSAPMPIDIFVETSNSQDYRYNLTDTSNNETIGSGRFHNGGGMDWMKINHAYTRPNVTSSYQDVNTPMSWQDFSYAKGSQWVFLTIPPMTTARFVFVTMHNGVIKDPNAYFGNVTIKGVKGYATI